jgi:hypothetical protein
MTDTVGNSISGKKSRPSWEKAIVPNTTKIMASMAVVTFLFTENSGIFIE